jgi:hypothetical protein
MFVSARPRRNDIPRVEKTYKCFVFALLEEVRGITPLNYPGAAIFSRSAESDYP